MPKIFQYLQYIIRFYKNEHLPIPVHAQVQDHEIKIELVVSEDDITLVFKKVKGKKPLQKQKLRRLLFF